MIEPFNGEQYKFPPIELICNTCPQLNMEVYEIILYDFHSRF